MMQIKLFSVRPDEQPAIKAYQEAHPDVELLTTTAELHPDTVTETQGVDGIVIQQRSPIGGEASFYQQLHDNGFKQISTRTAGYDVIDVSLANDADLAVTNVPAYSPRSVAEFALMQIFRLLRHTVDFDRQVAHQDFSWNGLVSREIHSVTVGIIGAGRIGGTLAGLLHSLGAKVLVYDVAPRVEVSYVAEYVSLPELLAQSDVISLHVDLNTSSTHLLNQAVFNQMKPGMLLVNASRGPVIDTPALYAAMDAGTVAAVALDTIEGEGPLFAKNLSEQTITDPIVKEALARPNVLLTPHIAFYTNIAVENMIQIALDDAIAIIKGQDSPHIV
ncbi:D-2-hydroxyacid dehydrogenase [Lacticaseibacillus saniviri]